MGLFFRKSFKIGPIKINLSKSGMGMSTGVKGARVGISSKGKKYITGGKGSIRYKKTIGNSNKDGVIINLLKFPFKLISMPFKTIFLFIYILLYIFSLPLKFLFFPFKSIKKIFR